jgi:hypothetical protein
MISASYYRELFLNHKDELVQANKKADNPYLTNTGKDLLNNLAFSATVADIFLNPQKFKIGKYSYVMDRSYAWEKQTSLHYKPFIYYVHLTGHILHLKKW